VEASVSFRLQVLGRSGPEIMEGAWNRQERAFGQYEGFDERAGSGNADLSGLAQETVGRSPE